MYNINAFQNEREVLVMTTLSENYFNVCEFGAVADGNTDDTAAIQACLDKAQQEGGTAYFPHGKYKIEGTLLFGKEDNGNKAFSIKGEGRGNSRSVLLKTNAGDIAQTKSRAKLEISSLAFNHYGPEGRSLFLDTEMSYGVYDCFFTNAAGNKSDMLCFNGSYTDIVNSCFGNASPEAYAIHCTTIKGKININSNIFDCRIHGPGKGLLVDSTNNNRPEGLKVSRNMFLNTGREQITVKNILHIDISNNMLDQSSKWSILLEPEATGLCGVYIMGNYISPAQDQKDGIAIEIVENDLLALTINVSNNMIAYTGYGFIAGKNTRQALLTGNAFNDVEHDAIRLINTRGSIVNANTIWMCKGESCVCENTLYENEAPIVQNNTTCVL